MSITDSKLYTIDAGILQKDACIVIVRTEWNALIVDKLEEGCRAILDKYEMTNYRVINVPGAFEIPYTIKNYWTNCQATFQKPQVFIALGCIMRGGTPHFDYVCNAVTNGILHLNLNVEVPTIFGILTVENAAQAMERLGGSHGHKGEEAAVTALKMLSLQYSIRQT